MTTVTMYIGQCGNQLGYQIDKCNLELWLRSPSYKYNSGGPPRFEQKLKKENAVYGHRGRGNNWALGYTGIGTEKILEESLESLRKEAERCDMFTNILMVHSLCGGTGGGLGSRILEELRQDYPLQQIISTVVAPFILGDTPLQHYNALLSLTALQKFSDAVLLFRNDVVQTVCSPSQAPGSASSPVGFSQMNRYISDCITGIATPTDTLTPQGGVSCGLELSELVRSACPQQTLKFLTASHVYRQTDDLKSLTYKAINMVKQSHMGKKCHSLSNIAILRGSLAEQIYIQLPKIEEKIKKELNSVNWNPFPVDFWLAKNSLRSGSGLSGTSMQDVTLITNFSNIADYTEYVLSKAQIMYKEKAYLHWYSKYNIDEEYFGESFATIQDLIEKYREAIR